MPAPDPILTASVYCSGRLDAVIHGVAAPTLERLRRDDPAASWRLWWVRYSRNGDHLKLRLHGPEAGREAARRLLAEAAGSFLAALPPADPSVPRVSRPSSPAIDVEDEATEDHPDRALLWTGYRRSHVSFGPRELLGDDDYVARIAECLSRGAEWVLRGTSLGADGTIPGAARRRALLAIVTAGLEGAGLDAEARAAYLAYHRDWLLRFSVADAAREAEIVAGFDRRVDGMRPTVDQLRAGLAGAAPGGEDPAALPWKRAVAALCAYAAPFRHDPAARLDPFAEDGAFPLVFKAFHGVANQLGLDMINEAFLHHLLLRAAEEDAPAPRVPAETAAAGAGSPRAVEA